MRPFFTQLDPEGCRRLRAVVMDMNPAYEEEVRTQCPHAEIVYDLFHVVARYGREVIDRVRVDEANRLRHDRAARQVINKRMASGYRDDAYFFLKIMDAFPGCGHGVRLVVLDEALLDGEVSHHVHYLCTVRESVQYPAQGSQVIPCQFRPHIRMRERAWPA